MTLGRLVCVLGLLGALGACTSPTGLIDAATMPAEDRSFSDSATDSEIKLAIDKGLLENSGQLYADVNTVVYEGRVLLTGKVATQDARQAAENIARNTQNVKKVIDELVVTTDRNFGAGVNDVANEVKIKAQLVATKDIKSINFRWRSVGGTVYLIGAAQSAQELQNVIEVIRNVGGVNKVVNYAWVRS
jgi:osmotically-inducible protein OsmY